MSINIRILIFIMGVLFFIMIFDLVRKRKFREELSVIWLIIGIAIILSSFADLIIDPIAGKLGIHYPPALVILILSFFLIFAILYFSIVLSDLKTKNKELSQKTALMEYKLNQVYKKKESVK